MIKLQSVSKIYNSVVAVDNISFEVNEGENMVLLGTSGCGKTTTLRMINRLAEPSKGEIFVNGTDIRKQPAEELRRHIGYVLQHNGLFPHYSIEENVGIVPGLLKWKKAKIQQRTYDLLNKLQLPPQQYAALYPNQLSGGQQQRVGLARALAAYPSILLMDEPFGALDPVTRNVIRRDLKQVEEFKEKTIVLVTHDVQEAFEFGDRICLMDKGTIVQLGTPVDLLFKPANDFVRTFFNEQRMTLELQALTIKDIFDQLPLSEGDFLQKISSRTNLWNTLQALSQDNPPLPGLAISLENGENEKWVNPQVLMAAYTAFKKQARHE